MDADAADALCADTVAAIFKQGLERSGGSYEELAAVEDYAWQPRVPSSSAAELDQPLPRPCSDARIHGNGDWHDGAFDKIARANTINASIVAGGIKVALITTVSGLVVAIILQIFYNYILSKIDGIVFDMEEASMDLVDLVYRNKLNG